VREPEFLTPAIYNAMIAIAEKRMAKADLAAIFRNNASTT
jgi:hypothetical protein